MTQLLIPVRTNRIARMNTNLFLNSFGHSESDKRRYCDYLKEIEYLKEGTLVSVTTFRTF